MMNESGYVCKKQKKKQQQKHKQHQNLFLGAFVNFKQAIDDVLRNGLWYKLLNNGLSGECLKFFRNMYNGVKSMVSINGQSSDFFNCNVEVRQSENLSPLLFSLFINDLEEFLAS